MSEVLRSSDTFNINVPPGFGIRPTASPPYVSSPIKNDVVSRSYEL